MFLFDEFDQPIDGGIMQYHWAAAIKLRLNFLSQLLSQLHFLLIKAVEVPDDTPHACIQGNQGSQNKWCDLDEHNRIGWVISF